MADIAVAVVVAAGVDEVVVVVAGIVHNCC